jgi:hypothetical protein
MAESNAKVHFPQGAEQMVVESGGTIKVNTGGAINFEVGATDITLTASGANIIIAGLPTTDPAVTGALWADTNVLKVSAGS